MSRLPRPVLITAGGTGGHVYPALAVARELLSREVPVLWLGTRKGLEARIVPEAGIPMVWLSVGGLRGKGALGWITAPFRLFWAGAQALVILFRHRPRAVLGMGGFVSGPGAAMAWLLRIPVVIHEQNAVAGLTNRMLSRLARRVLEAFPGTFAGSRQPLHTGNPVRTDIAALPDPQTRGVGSAERLRLLVIGGSQGARALNEGVPRALRELAPKDRPEVWHQAGPRNYETTRDGYRLVSVQARVEPYIEDMAAAYAWADLVLCRSGALTVSELEAAGVGAILVPFPYAVDDHQTVNAQQMVSAGAAVLLPQAQLEPARLCALLSRLKNEPGRLLNMARAARSLAMPEATRQVADACLEVASPALSAVGGER